MMTPTATRYRDYLLEAGGDFGPYGGMHVPEVLRPNMEAVAEGFEAARRDPAFETELLTAYQTYTGRPTPLTELPRLSDALGGARLLLKNEGLLLTGAHKITHCIGQVLLARRLGKRRIIAETGAGQHGVATATVCARYGLDCTVYMGQTDYNRQRPNVYWMELMGARVVPVASGAGTLNDAVIAAFQDLIQHPDETYYLLGSAVGPHPYPVMNAYFQRVVGQEVRAQAQAQYGVLPDGLLACVGGGSNALGLFWEFLDAPGVRLIGVEAGGVSETPGGHAAKLTYGAPGVFEGYASYFLQTGGGNISPTHSVSAGLDYCGVSPILAYLKDQGRLEATVASDAEVLEALGHLARTEGILLALESAHALAAALRLAPTLPKDQTLVIGGSGRAEKDLFITFPRLQPDAFRRYLTHQLDAHG